MKGIQTTMIGNLMVGMAALFLVSACDGGPEPAAPAPSAAGADAGTGNDTNNGDDEDQCGGNADYVIRVSFSDPTSDSNPHCPLSVGPAEPQGSDGDTYKCASNKPNCIRKSINGATKVRWVSEPSGVAFGVYFDPFVGPKHETKNGCVKATISGGGNSEKIPPSNAGVQEGTEVTYKYTIATLTGSPAGLDPACAPLDPPIIIEH